MEAIPRTTGVHDAGQSTAEASNTVCLFDPRGDLLTLGSRALEEFSEYGDIARVDLSLVVVMNCALLTYFDVRSAQQVLLHYAGRAEPFPPLAHDCRIVRVRVGAFFERLPVLAATGGFGQFGKVAHVSMSGGDALVEYYDMRAAQRLLSVAGNTASPVLLNNQQQQPPSANISHILASMGHRADLAGMGNFLGEGLEAGMAGSNPLTPAPAPAPAFMPATPGHMSGGQMFAATPVPSSPTAEELAALGEETNRNDAAATADKGSARPVRSRITMKDFSKYDIEPEKIARGEDPRTTCMIRNLAGPHSRKDFLTFLERCGLHERYTFFYMPCKERRNIPAGFAFVNFIAPCDVHNLYTMVKSGFWREVMTDPVAKAPAVSYARFQGHAELAKHFNSSAVLHEHDPDKRPIFRCEVLKPMAEGAFASEGGTGATGGPLLPQTSMAPAVMVPHAGADMVAVHAEETYAHHAPYGAAPGLTIGDDWHAALSKGAQEIAAILSRQSAPISPEGMGAPGLKVAPAKVVAPSMKKAVHGSSGSSDSGQSYGFSAESLGA